jgi:hypothetical protein
MTESFFVPFFATPAVQFNRSTEKRGGTVGLSTASKLKVQVVSAGFVILSSIGLVSQELAHSTAKIGMVSWATVSRASQAARLPRAISLRVDGRVLGSRLATPDDESPTEGLFTESSVDYSDGALIIEES